MRAAPRPMLSAYSSPQQCLAEFVGTAALLCTVIGSGIMAERLSGGNAAVALLANTLATVFMLYVLIETLGPISGAHFNPLVTLVQWSNGLLQGSHPTRTALYFISFQLIGAVVGAWLAHLMFDLPIFQFSNHLRGGFDAGSQFTGWGQWVAEAVATAGLIFTIQRSPCGKASALVACYIGAAYWAAASTSFANPAAVLGRSLSDSFAGIAPASALGFIASQCVGAWVGAMASNRLKIPKQSNDSTDLS